MKTKHAGALAAFLFATTALTGVANAQSAVAPPEVFQAVDKNGVDLTTGAFHVDSPVASVGTPNAGGLAYTRTYDSAAGAWRDNYQGAINSTSPGSYADGVTVTVSIGETAEEFTLSGGVFVPSSGQTSTLTLSGSTYTYTMRDGTVATFTKTLSGAGIVVANEARLTSLVHPNGETLTFTYTGAGGGWSRLQSVTNNRGYQLHFEYDDSGGANTGRTLTKVVALNNAVDYCAPTANSCSFSRTWSSVTYGSSPQTATDSLNRTTTFSDTGTSYSVTRPSTTTTITHSGSTASAVSNGTATWSYSFVDSGLTRTATVTDPLSHQRVVTSEIATGLVNSETNGLGQTRTFSYDTNKRLHRVTEPEGDYVELAYDGRGNLSQVTRVARPGTGLSNIVESATYPGSCSNPVTCNKPTSITDALGNQTDYTYDATHGGVLTVTRPAPSSGMVRPQIRFSYDARYAHFKDSTGSIVAASTPIYVLTTSSQCATNATCSGTSDELLTTLSYGSATTSVRNNLDVSAYTVGAGDASLSATVAYTYDDAGNARTIDGPVGGSADLVTFRYDTEHQLVGVVGVDPDGGGPLKYRARRLTYNGDGNVIVAEQGTVNGTSDADWAAFSSLTQTNVTYDGVGRRTKVSLAAGGTTYSVTQFSWDNADRLDCFAVRMNPAVFASLPSSACSLGTAGSNGADQISRITYDAADRGLKITHGYGTALQRDERTFTFGADGEVQTVADGKAQLTTFEYDGFNRLVKVRYPTPSPGTTSSTTDYELYSFDAASRVTQVRRRSGAVIGISYDTLGRIRVVTPPTGEPALTYAYDNLGRRQSVTDSSTTTSWAYDALGRLVSETGPLGTVSYQYDLAGRRIRMTWPDSFYVSYDRDGAGEITAMRENGASSGAGVLATISYNDRGNVTGVTYGNSASTTFAYDGVARPTGITQDLSGTTNDVTFTYAYDPASRISSRTISNSNYTWNGSPTDFDFSFDGQNKLTTFEASSLSSDTRGNLVGDGMSTFSFDTFNRLTSGGGATYAFDPVGRLSQATVSGSSTRYLYDGSVLIGEANASGVLQRRYVPSPIYVGPIVWYEGSGTSDRRTLLTDSIGSIVSVTDSTGASIATNTYSDFGTPSPGNLGRFQFAGEMWLTEPRVYHAPQRDYSPILGRFLQPDPIGLAGDTNLYNRVGQDPVNKIDPSGLVEGEATEVDPIIVRACSPARGCYRYPFDYPMEEISGIMNGGGVGGGDGGSDKCAYTRKAPFIMSKIVKDGGEVLVKLGLGTGALTLMLAPETAGADSPGMIVSVYLVEGGGQMSLIGSIGMLCSSSLEDCLGGTGASLLLEAAIMGMAAQILPGSAGPIRKGLEGILGLGAPDLTRCTAQ